MKQKLTKKEIILYVLSLALFETAALIGTIESRLLMTGVFVFFMHGILFFVLRIEMKMQADKEFIQKFDFVHRQYEKDGDAEKWILFLDSFQPNTETVRKTIALCKAEALVRLEKKDEAIALLENYTSNNKAAQQEINFKLEKIKKSESSSQG